MDAMSGRGELGDRESVADFYGLGRTGRTVGRRGRLHHTGWNTGLGGLGRTQRTQRTQQTQRSTES